MAYTSAYQYDIFISYAHDDNTALAEYWVSQFRDYLENWLVKRRRLKGLEIWFDDKLHGNTAFDQAIQDSISQSALFFVIHSLNYHDSEYCRKELHWFLEDNQKHPNGTMVGDDSRIFNILVNNIHHDKWPDDLAGTSGFPLHDAEDDDAFGYPTSSKQALFDEQLRPLVEATARILDKILKTQPEELSPTENTANTPKIFIADVADTLSRH